MYIIFHIHRSIKFTDHPTLEWYRCTCCKWVILHCRIRLCRIFSRSLGFSKEFNCIRFHTSAVTLSMIRCKHGRCIELIGCWMLGKRTTHPLWQASTLDAMTTLTATKRQTIDFFSWQLWTRSPKASFEAVIMRLSLYEFTLWRWDLVSVVRIRESLYYTRFFWRATSEDFFKQE